MFIDNLHIIIEKDSEWYERIRNFFIKITEDGEKKELYSLDEDENILIDKGLRFLLPFDLLKDCQDCSDNDLYIDIKEDPEFYKDLIDGITLREDQIITVMKCLYHKRGICQNPTGSGKTVCIAAVLRYYYLMLGYYPTTLVFEPTNYLVDQTVERFNSFGIPATKYKDHRKSIEGVVVSHPLSLLNDLKKDGELFSEVKIFIADEAHHTSCDTWYSIYQSLSGVEVALGFSASVIDQSKIPITDISILTYDEALLFGCMGNLITNFPVSYYIEKGILATPVLFRMNNPASEWVYDDRDWHQLRKKKLESPNRNKIICDVTTLFNILNFKTLILVGTKVHAESIIKMLSNYGIADRCVCSYGGGEYLKLVDGKLVDCHDENPKERFESGELNIMIGTTHLYEGADIPNLDIIVLASVGKQPRKLIQGVGRSLRRTKTGHYAYIIDFTDHMSGVLSYHSNIRMNMYKEIIGVRPNNIFDNCTIQMMKDTVRQLEGL